MSKLRKEKPTKRSVSFGTVVIAKKPRTIKPKAKKAKVRTIKKGTTVRAKAPKKAAKKGWFRKRS